jgi:ribonuclease-3
VSRKLGNLENRIGYKFGKPDLLQRALTHRSWAVENLPGADDEKIREHENESMEFVGDSVLGLIIAEDLFLRHPKMDEGDLTLMKHHLVSTTTLARIAAELGLGEFVRFGRGEEKSGGRKKQALLANTMEAVIAAVFFDGGYVEARVFVRSVYAEEIKKATPTNSADYKSLLQEKLQAQKLAAPDYKVVRTEGEPHQRTFFVETRWDGGKASGEGSSIKAAEMDAAFRALKSLDGKNGDHRLPEE